MSLGAQTQTKSGDSQGGRETGPLAILKQELVDKSIDLTKDVKRKVLWKCSSCNNIWSVAIHRRKSGQGCPNCKRSSHGEKVAAAAAKKNPLSDELRSQLFDKSLTLSASSKKKVSWICDVHGVYEMRVDSRSAGKGCYSCKRYKIKDAAFNRNPLSEDLRSELIHDVDVSASSRDRVGWKCSKGHTWHTAVYCRTSGTGCPVCSKSGGRSRGESELADALQFYGFNIITNSRDIIPPYEIDILLVDLDVGIEYNGEYWHSKPGAKSRDLIKMEMAESLGIRILYVDDEEWRQNPEKTFNKLMDEIDAYKVL